jgi:predicted TIM-barrel fold metal-dependent hydrolase
MTMRYDYFHYTDLDRRFYEEHLKTRMPARFLDAHTHINLPEHIVDVPPERIADDWALQNGLHMTAEDAAYYYHTLFPDQQWAITAFPFPVKEVHLDDNNDYVAKCAKEGKIAYGLRCIRPEDSCERIERDMTEKQFSGLKPYPDLVSGKKGSEIGIYQFLPHEQLALAERKGYPIVLHLPRAGRMPDENNLRELREIRQKYPNIVIIIAHCGRCYTPWHFERALDGMGEELRGYYFDTAAVANPEVLRMALARVERGHLLFGTDEPIFLWHGYREWTKTQYFNVAREDFPWNKNRKSPEEEAGYTFFVYRQIDNLLTELERAHLGEEGKNEVFLRNAQRVFGGSR